MSNGSKTQKEQVTDQVANAEVSVAEVEEVGSGIKDKPDAKDSAGQTASSTTGPKPQGTGSSETTNDPVATEPKKEKPYNPRTQGQINDQSTN